jgi:hypothetical protein
MPSVKRLSVMTKEQTDSLFQAGFYAEGVKAGIHENDGDGGKRGWYVTVGRAAEWELIPEVRTVWDEGAGIVRVEIDE